MYGEFCESHRKEQMDICRLIHDYAEKAYKAGYEESEKSAHFEGYREGVRNGREEAWECAKKLCQSEKYGGLEEHCAEIFGIPNGNFDVFDASVEVALTRVHAFEDKHTKYADKSCESCKYEDEPEFTSPCVDCSRNHKDMWEAKR